MKNLGAANQGMRGDVTNKDYAAIEKHAATYKASFTVAGGACPIAPLPSTSRPRYFLSSLDAIALLVSPSVLDHDARLA